MDRAVTALRCLCEFRRWRLRLVPFLLLPACGAGVSADQIAAIDSELAAVVTEFRGDHHRFGVLFARYDGRATTVRVAGDITADDHLRLASISKVFGDDYGLGLQRYDLGELGEGLGHDGHINARTVLLRLGDPSYLIHTTGPVGNPELKMITRRLLASHE